MFYVIALAGAHKKVINQLREKLVMVGRLDGLQSEGLPGKNPCTEILPGFLFYRRARTNASWSGSCVRPRMSEGSNPHLGSAVPAGRAPATTPASPAISARRWSWHILHQSPLLTCEARRRQTCGCWTNKINTISTLFLLFLHSFVLFCFPVLTLTRVSANMLTSCQFSVFFLWHIFICSQNGFRSAVVFLLVSFPSKKDLISH